MSIAYRLYATCLQPGCSRIAARRPETLTVWKRFKNGTYFVPILQIRAPEGTGNNHADSEFTDLGIKLVSAGLGQSGGHNLLGSDNGFVGKLQEILDGVFST